MSPVRARLPLHILSTLDEPDRSRMSCMAAAGPRPRAEVEARTPFDVGASAFEVVRVRSEPSGRAAGQGPSRSGRAGSLREALADQGRTGSSCPGCCSRRTSWPDPTVPVLSWPSPGLSAKGCNVAGDPLPALGLLSHSRKGGRLTPFPGREGVSSCYRKEHAENQTGDPPLSGVSAGQEPRSNPAMYLDHGFLSGPLLIAGRRRRKDRYLKLMR
jgi:hypothetical protein